MAKKKTTPPVAVVVMGVSGCGKSSVGSSLAEHLGLRFLEGDALHPPANIVKMEAGIPLDDTDRWPWLAAIGEVAGDELRNGRSVIVSCSSLKTIYRDALRDAMPGPVAFIYLCGSPQVLAQRMTARKGHFMPAALLESQLQTLEPPVGEPLVVTVDIDTTPQAVVTLALEGLRALDVI